MEVELSLSEQQDLNQIAEILQIDDGVKALSEKYLKEYKTKSHHQSPNEKSLLTVGSAVLASVKSSSFSDKERITSRQIVNALKNVSKQDLHTEEFLTVLKQFTSQVSLSEKVVANIKGTINKFVLSYTLYIKYQEMFNKLDLQSASFPLPNDYFANLKNIGWLIYLYVRSNSTLPNQTDLIQFMFMIFESITYLICYSPSSVESKLFERTGKNVDKKEEGAVQEAVFELIKLNAKSSEDIANNTKSFKDCLNKLIENKTIQSQNQQSFDGMFDPDVLNANFKNLEDFYLKNMSDDDLDERFYREEHSRKPPVSGRSTPLVKQPNPANNKLNINVNITNEDEKGITRSSYNKPLNYEVSEQMRLGSQLRDVKNSMRSIPASPQIGAMTPQRGTVTATPMSKALENYKWLNEKLKLRKNESGFPPVLDKYLSATETQKEEIMRRVNSILDCEQGSVSSYDSQIKKQIKDKQHQIINIYFKVLEELLVQEERKTKRAQYSEIIRNDNFHRALIAASIETVFFVNNYTDLSFTMLLELCNINSFEFWRIIASFVKFDSNMPHQLRKHFSDLEVKILLHLAWKKNSPVLNVINHFIQQSKVKKEPKSSGSQESNLEDNSNSTNEASHAIKAEERAKEEKPFDLTHSQSLFFKRLLHHVAVQICQICEKLNLNDTIAESVWQAIQKVLGDHTLLLVDRHVAQLLLCCIYGVCKALKHPLKFQEIINKYQEIPVFQKDEYSEIVHQVRLNETEKIDLITFYNKVFILEMKNFILSLSQDKNKQGSATPLAKPIVPPLVQSSPLKEFLSTHLMLGAASQENKATPSMSKFGLTPRTKALYAFGESPGGVLDSINKVTSKRHIDYDESQDPGVSKRYAKTPSSIMDKIIGNVGGKESDHSKPLPSKRNLFGTTNPLGVTTKKTNDESSQSQSLLASESSNTSTISLPIPQDGTRSVTSLAGNIEKFNMNSGNKE